MSIIQSLGTGGIQGVLESLKKITKINQEVNEIARESATYQAQMSLDLTRIEADGLAAQLQINQVVSEQAVLVDVENLRTRGQQMLASKAMEMATLIASYREKMLSMFITVFDQRVQSSWGRIKQATQGFKF